MAGGESYHGFIAAERLTPLRATLVKSHPEENMFLQLR